MHSSEFEVKIKIAARLIGDKIHLEFVPTLIKNATEIIFFSGATAQLRPGPPNSSGF
jgi:hypothetical protein